MFHSYITSHDLSKPRRIHNWQLLTPRIISAILIWQTHLINTHKWRANCNSGLVGLFVQCRHKASAYLATCEFDTTCEAQCEQLTELNSNLYNSEKEKQVVGEGVCEGKQRSCEERFWQVLLHGPHTHGQRSKQNAALHNPHLEFISQPSYEDEDGELK